MNITLRFGTGNDFKGNTNKLENTQRLFTKRLFSRCNIPYIEYPDRVLFLNMNSLSHRILKNDMVLMYKELVDVKSANY